MAETLTFFASAQRESNFERVKKYFTKSLLIILNENPTTTEKTLIVLYPPMEDKKEGMIMYP